MAAENICKTWSICQELHLNGQVTFSTNLLPMADLPAFIGQADLGIVPYRREVFTDGILPTKLMEYTELHMPVIGARTPAIEAYFDEDIVQYFPAEDVNALCVAIIYLYKHRVRLQQLSAGSNRFNEKYAWENIARQYLELVIDCQPRDFSEGKRITRLAQIAQGVLLYIRLYRVLHNLPN